MHRGWGKVRKQGWKMEDGGWRSMRLGSGGFVLRRRAGLWRGVVHCGAGLGVGMFGLPHEWWALQTSRIMPAKGASVMGKRQTKQFKEQAMDLVRVQGYDPA